MLDLKTLFFKNSVLQFFSFCCSFIPAKWENTNTTKMDAIKKKMQAMKLEKENAMDRALNCEQEAKDANLRAEKVIIHFIFWLYKLRQKFKFFCKCWYIINTSNFC